MSRHQSYIPESIDHFALKIVHRLHLDQGAMLGFIATIIREAVYEERKSVHMRETVGCFGCQTLMLRYEGLNEQYCTRCPNCHEPMLTQVELYRKKYHLLEEKLKGE
jgi:hypothetical protein